MREHSRKNSDPADVECAVKTSVHRHQFARDWNKNPDTLSEKHAQRLREEKASSIPSIVTGLKSQRNDAEKNG
jgi:hypothetical protein